MKKLLSFILAAVLCLCIFTGCGKNTAVYNYKLDNFTASIWGGSELSDITVDETGCSLVFDAKNKEIEFTCDGKTFKGELTSQISMEGSDTWKVIWHENPEGSDSYKFSYSAVMCSSNYDKASPFVRVLFYFDGEKDSIEIEFSMKHTEE